MNTQSAEFKGRKPTARAKADEIRRLAGEGLGKAEIAARFAISARSVYRVLAGRALPALPS